MKYARSLAIGTSDRHIHLRNTIKNEDTTKNEERRSRPATPFLHALTRYLVKTRILLPQETSIILLPHETRILSSHEISVS